MASKTKSRKRAKKPPAPTPASDEDIFDTRVTEDDRRRAHELIQKYGWEHLRKKG